MEPKIITRAEREARRMRGLGDVVAAVAGALGIPKCVPCGKRQEALNRAVPFGSRQKRSINETTKSDGPIK